MPDLFIIFEPQVKNDNCKILEDSIRRYFDIVKKEEDVTPHVFNDIKAIELVEYLDEDNSNDITCVQTINHSNLFVDIQKLLQETYSSNFNESNASHLRQRIKKSVFHDFVSTYSHGAGTDLVNSPLGIVNVWAYNHNRSDLDAVLTDLEKKSILPQCVIYIKSFIAKLQEMLKTYGESRLFRDDIQVNIDLAEQIKDALIKLNAMNNNFINFTKVEKKDLSEKLFIIFRFISRYAKET